MSGAHGAKNLMVISADRYKKKLSMTYYKKNVLDGLCTGKWPDHYRKS